jgi:DNA-directed RNA polymerase subunit H (RpoH/RPB5)
MSQQALRRGDLVEVKSPSEILVTLDERGALSDLPFMSEMASYCGRRFTVERRAEKVCDTIDYTGSRRLHDSVLLDDLRCDGSGHDGCQAECRLFWKEAWLRKVSPQEPPHPPFPPGELSALIERASRHARSTVRIDGKDQQRYRCQSTDLTKCTEHLKLWDLRAYVREYTSGNIRLGHFLRVTTRAALQEPMRKLGLVPEVHVAGTAKKGDVFESLDLRPGDLVRVKTKEEIAATLNAEGRNKGLWFDREMLPYCGGTFRVRQRLNRFINDRDGSLVVLKNDGVTLDGVVCSGDLSLRRWFCPRNIYPFWRECWLERVEPTAEPASGSPRELAPWPSDRSRSSEE